MKWLDLEILGRGLGARLGLKQSSRVAGDVQGGRMAQAGSSEVRRLLFIRTDSIGDNLLAAGLLPFVAAAFPRASITVLCQASVQDVYRHCPHVNALLTFDKERYRRKLSYRIKLNRVLRRSGFDMVLNSVYSREWITDFLVFASKAPVRIGFSGDLSNISERRKRRLDPGYTELITCHESWSELAYHRAFLGHIGHPAALPGPRIWLQESEVAWASAYFSSQGLDPAQTVALFAGAQHGIRHYDHYGKALNGLAKAEGLSVLALGGAQDRVINQRNLSDLEVPTHDCSGQTSLRKAAALLSLCRLAVGAETGLAHLSCALGVPNVIVLGGGHFGRFMPYSGLTSVACLPMDCFGCNWKCIHESPHCIQGVPAETLAQAIQEAWFHRATCSRFYAPDPEALNVNPWVSNCCERRDGLG